MPDRVTHPPFELATFVADDVVPADANAWEDGRLHLDLGALAEAVMDGGLASVEIEVVRPGDQVRIANVLDAVLPDVKADEPGSTFPGALGALAPCGHGRTNRVEGVSVLSVCDWLAAGYTTDEGFPDSLVDMDGPGASLTRWGSTTNVVVRCVPAEGAPLGDVDRAVRRASLRVARDIAATTVDREPDGVETFSAPAPDVDPGLPAVCGILQIASEGPLTDTFLYGRAVGGIDPDPARSARTAGRRVDERRVRLAGRPQRHRVVPGLVPGPDAPRGTRSSGCGSPDSSSRSATWIARSRSSDPRCCPRDSLAGWEPMGRSARRSRPATPIPTRC